MTRERQVAVVGGGLAGAACAASLREAGVDVTLFERGRAPGGRLASPELFGRRVDLGAAYFTVSDPAFGDDVSRWQAAGLVREWTDSFDVFDGTDRKAAAAGPTRWATTNGTRSLVREVLKGVDVRLSTEIRSVGPGTRLRESEFDLVVLAMPDPQAAWLLQPDCGVFDALDVGYEPTLAVAGLFAERNRVMRHGAFVNNHPVLSFVADDGSRRGDGAPVLVAHTTADFARRHLDDPARAVPEVLAALDDLLHTGDPLETHVHRWTYAKPVGKHEAPYLIGEDGIAVAGDAWCPDGNPRVESAWLSGTAVGHAIAQRL